MRPALALLLVACAAAGRELPARVLARGVLAYDVALSGDRLATVELATEFELVVRDGEGRVARRLRLGEPTWDVVSLAVAGNTAAVASLDGRVRLVDVARATVTADWRLDDAATAVAFSPDGGWLLHGAESGVVCLRRVADGALLQCVAAHAARVTALAFCGDRAASASWDGRVQVWQVPSLRTVQEIRRAGVANDVAFAPDCRSLAVAGSARPPRRPPPEADADPVVEVWPLDGRSPRRLVGHRAAPVAVAFAGPGRLLSGAWDGTVRVWDPRSGRELGRQSGYAGIVRALAAGAGGRRAWVASWSGPDGEGWSVTLLDLAAAR
jgi:WD40 repeat protein